MWIPQPATPAAEANSRDAFEFAPAPLTVLLPEALDVSNLCSDRDSFNAGNLADDREVHAHILPLPAGPSRPQIQKYWQ
jgi:hypothetical protein